MLDIFLTVVAASMGWHVLCEGWGRETNLIEPGWTFSAIGCGDGISACVSCTSPAQVSRALRIFPISDKYFPPTVATTVQWFYAWRIWRIKLWRVIPGLIVCVRSSALWPPEVERLEPCARWLALTPLPADIPSPADCHANHSCRGACARVNLR